MALFTTQQASASEITRCEARFSDTGNTNHMYFIFGIKDTDGINYDWKDFDLAAGSDTDTIKTAIHDYLVANIQKIQPKTESTMNDEGIIGSNPG